MQKIYLYAENGVFVEATSFGAKGTFVGEVAVSTSMIGYEDEIYDHTGKALLFTMTEIGNVGVVSDTRPAVGAVIARNYQERPSNYLSVATLGDSLTKHNILGVTQIDTRALLKSIPANAKVVISTELTTPDQLKSKL